MFFNNDKLNPVSPYSRNFFRINDKLKTLTDEINKEKEQGKEVSKEERKKRFDKIVTSFGVQPEEFQKSFKEYEEIIGGSQNIDRGRELILQNRNSKNTNLVNQPIFFPGAPAMSISGGKPVAPASDTLVRLTGRTLENIGDVPVVAATALEATVRPDATFDDIYKRNEIAFDSIKDKIPNEYRKAFQKFFDPYHGEGLAEPIAAEILSLLTGGKLAKEAIKKLSPGMKQTKTFEGPTRAYLEKLLTSKTAKFAGGITGGAVLYAAMDDAPEEYTESLLFDTVPEFLGDVYDAMKDNPKAQEAAEELRKNPENSAAEGYLNNFLDALGFGVLGGAFIASLKGTVVKGTEVIKSAPGIKRLELLPPSWRAKLSSRAGTSNEALDLVTRRSNFNSALNMQLQGRARDLKNLVNKTTKRGEQREKVKETINTIWSTDPKKSSYDNLLNQLPDDVARLVREMDGEFRNLQKMTGLTRGQLRATIGKNGDSYVTRDYEFFDYGRYRDKVINSFEAFAKAVNTGDAAAMRAADPDGFFTSLVDVLGKNSGRSTKSALDDLAKLIDKGRGNDKDTFNMFKAILQQDANIANKYIGQKRKDLPKSLREVLKEVKDPYRNYVTTMSNISQAFAESDFLEEMSKIILKNNQGAIARKSVEGEISDAVSKGFVSLADVGEERLGMIFGRGVVSKGQVNNPLKDVYATPEYAEFIRQGLNVTRPDSSIMKLLMTARGGLTIGQTAFSTATMGVNVMGNALLMIANGMIPIGKGLGNASKVGTAQLFGQNNFVSKMLGMNNKELGDFVAKYQKLGLLGQSVKANILKRQLQLLGDNPKLLDIVVENGGDPKQLAKSGIDLAKFGFNKVTDFYQLQDDLFKMMHFEKTLDYMSKSRTYGKLDLPSLEIAAAQRTRDLLPNYSMIPKGIKELSGGPVIGEFAAFPAEISRITKNLFTYTANDLASLDPALMAAGAKRLAGINALAITPYAMQQYSREINGITKEEEDAIERSIVSDFDYMSPRIYLSPIQTIRTGEGGQQKRRVLEYFNFGRIDPMSYLKRPALMMNAMFQEGNYSQDQINRAVAATASEIVSPFLAPSMLTDAMGKFYDRAGEIDDAPFAQQAADYFSLLGDISSIGTYRYYENSDDYNKQKLKYGEDIRPVKKYGLAYAENEFGPLAFAGLKPSVIDFDGSVKYTVDQPLKDWKRSNRNVQDYFKESASIIQDTPEYYEEVKSKAADSLERAIENQRKFSAVFDDYETIFKNRVEGGGEQVILDGYSAAGLRNPPKDFQDVLSYTRANRVAPIKLTPTDEQLFLQGIPVRIEDLLNRMEIGADTIKLFE